LHDAAWRHSQAPGRCSRSRSRTLAPAGCTSTEVGDTCTPASSSGKGNRPTWSWPRSW